MQQYYDIDSGSGTLTIFHTESEIGFDVEHFGGFAVVDSDLLQFLQDETTQQYTVTQNRAERFPDLHKKSPELYPDIDEQMGELEKNSDGSLTIRISARRSLECMLTADQVTCLRESITVGSVERYDDGQYPVEFVSRDGSRDRAEHN